MDSKYVDLPAFKQWLNTRPQPKYPFKDGKRWAIIGHLNDLFDGDEGRHAFTLWAFEEGSSKDLTDTQLQALWDWLSSTCDETGKVWTIREQCAATAAAWLLAYQEELGQLDMFETEANE